VSLSSADGRRLTRLLRLGRDSDDWALSRPDLRFQVQREKAHPWVHWVSRQQFFASRYRMSWPLAPAFRSPPTRLAVTRSPRLPADVTLSIFFIGAER
ncbi:MAG TPA: hypothetical protein VKA53_02210, partial [Thermoanaerobaculia bacterium]|nr:hypothetical protein [Thermoanaerobaculia bacterium]